MMKNIESKVREIINTYSHEDYLDGYIKSEFITEDGDADIYLKVNGEENLYDERTEAKQLDLNSNIYEYVESKSSMLDNNVPIKLHLTGVNLDKKKQEQVKHIFREHFAIELYKRQKKYIKIKNKISMLIILGLLFLTVYAVLYLYTKLDFFLEVFGFLFSFSLWQALESMIYDFSEVKDERQAVTQNLLIKIIFD